MKVRNLTHSVFMVGLLAFGIVQEAAAETYSFKKDHVLGTSFEMQVIADSQKSADQAWKASLDRVAGLDAVLSTWRSDSEISKLNQQDEVVVSGELFEVLSLCEKYREETAEGVSCRLGRVLQSWREAEKSGVAPEAGDISRLSDAIAEAPLVLDTATKRVSRPDAIVFAVDSLAKGWILDRAADAALASGKGVKGVLLNIGGDLKVAGDVSDHTPRVGIAAPGAADNEAPMETILLARGAVASSGDGKRSMKIDGRMYSHILSPIDGMPQTKTAVATVVAPDAAQADALATAFTVMGVGRSLAYANSHDGVEAVLITTGGARFASKGWASLIAPVEKKSAAAAGIENPWPEGFRLEIEYEVPRIDAANYEAPYIAVWVTDEKKKLVRSLLLLGDAPRWLEENYRFWRRYGRKHQALVDTLAQPSRKPGRYDLVWDGRDDEGTPVPKGVYILHVEASREHGGHSYKQQKLHLLDTIAEAIIPAQAEIGDVMIHYGASD